MKKNKLFALLLAGIMTLSIAGCGASEQVSEMKPSDEAESTTVYETTLTTEKKKSDSTEAESTEKSEAETLEITSVAETQTAAENEVPEQTENPKPENQSAALKTETADRTETPKPAEKEKQAEPEKPTEAQPTVEPVKQKTAYDYAFDVESIRYDLIAIGEGMGLTHITTDDGNAITPSNASWSTPITASESYQGDKLKRKLTEYVKSMPGIISAYGGESIEYFTIYVQANGNGSYTFYFLY